MTDVVRVWIVPVDVPPEAAALCRAVLDESERLRAAAFAYARDKERFTIAHGALRILAGRELATRPGALTWIPGRYGKPALAPPWSRLHTSLSHSADMIAVAISTGRPVGVDIQHVVVGLDAVRMSSRFYPPDEARYVAAGSDATARADRFARLWTRKEAVVKAAGGRLWPNLKIAVRDVSSVVTSAEPPGPYRVADVAAPQGFHAAVALTGPDLFRVVVATARLQPRRCHNHAVESAAEAGGFTDSSPAACSLASPRDQAQEGFN